MVNSLLPPVLIVGYRRTKNIETIVKLSIAAGIPDIYVYLDGFQNPSERDLGERQTLLEFLELNRSLGLTNIEVLVSPTNSGCAVSVLNAITWAFGDSEDLVILEDDCIPSKDFFFFCRDSRSILNSSQSIWLACGSQFVPISITKGDSYVSKYALTWGWYTTKEKWSQILASLKSFSASEAKLDFWGCDSEKVFWAAGARRAWEGRTDVWDTLLLYSMQNSNSFALLPAVPLVSNIGNDQFATHTSLDKTWTNRTVGSYSGELMLEKNNLADGWLKSNFYSIQLRHIFTTKITWILDLIRKPKFSSGLFQRMNILN